MTQSSKTLFQARDLEVKISSKKLPFIGEAKEILALQAASVSLNQGEVVAICGENGSGKSTMLNVLLGVQAVSNGTLCDLEGSVLHNGLGQSYVLGVVSQTNSLDLKLTVSENLKLAAGLFGISRSEASSRSEKLLNAFGLLERLNDKVAQLSGGQKRKVDIARALIGNPRLLVMDEPGAGLDRKSVPELWEMVSSWLSSEDTALEGVLFVSHHAAELDYANRIVLLNKGVTVANVTRADLAEFESHDRLSVGIESEQSAQRLQDVMLKNGATLVSQEGLQFEYDAKDGHTLVPKLFEGDSAPAIESIQLRAENSLDKVSRTQNLQKQNRAEGVLG